MVWLHISFRIRSGTYRRPNNILKLIDVLRGSSIPVHYFSIVFYM